MSLNNVTSNLLYVRMKDEENSGYIFDEFYCPDCLNFIMKGCKNLKILNKKVATPKVLSRIYPPLVDEPRCGYCGLYFKWYTTLACSMTDAVCDGKVFAA